MHLMSGTQSEEATVEVVEEKSGSFRMLPALPSSGMDEQPTTSGDHGCVFQQSFFVLAARLLVQYLHTFNYFIFFIYSFFRSGERIRCSPTRRIKNHPRNATVTTKTKRRPKTTKKTVKRRTARINKRRLLIYWCE